MQNIDDQSAVYDYASPRHEFGGLFHDGDVLVVLFTADLDRHEQAIRALSAEPDLIRVLPASRSWTEVTAANELIQSRLLGAAAHPAVTTVGIVVQDGQFAIGVGIWPHTAEIVAEIERLCAPEAVEVRAQDRPRLLTG
jgi:hypothetical protein